MRIWLIVVIVIIVVVLVIVSLPQSTSVVTHPVPVPLASSVPVRVFYCEAAKCQERQSFLYPSVWSAEFYHANSQVTMKLVLRRDANSSPLGALTNSLITFSPDAGFGVSPGVFTILFRHTTNFAIVDSDLASTDAAVIPLEFRPRANTQFSLPYSTTMDTARGHTPEQHGSWTLSVQADGSLVSATAFPNDKNVYIPLFSVTWQI